MDIIRPQIDSSVIITIPLVLDQGCLMVKSLVQYFNFFFHETIGSCFSVPNQPFSLLPIDYADLSSGSAVDSVDPGKISCSNFSNVLPQKHWKLFLSIFELTFFMCQRNDEAVTSAVAIGTLPYLLTKHNDVHKIFLTKQFSCYRLRSMCYISSRIHNCVSPLPTNIT